jgi:hypothetical protein
MEDEHRTISLGFTKQRFPLGVHVCQIVGSDAEREEAVLQFLLSGLRAGERTSCFSDKVTRNRVAEYFESEGISFDEASGTGTLTLAGVRDIYFVNDRFDPDRMLEVLARYHEESVAQGFTAARVIGEMSPEVQHMSGGDRLLEYESKVSLLLREHPVTAVCQYDARSFDGSTIMDLLKVHPLMVVRGSVVHNPFYIPPEEFLGPIQRRGLAYQEG